MNIICASDPSFLANNMLTADDFNLANASNTEIDDDFNFVMEEENMLEEISREFEFPVDDYIKNMLTLKQGSFDLLNNGELTSEYLTDLPVKEETLSPSSTPPLLKNEIEEVWSDDGFPPQISIPGNLLEPKVEIYTPPDSPPSGNPDSPSNSSIQIVYPGLNRNNPNCTLSNSSITTFTMAPLITTSTGSTAQIHTQPVLIKKIDSSRISATSKTQSAQPVVLTPEEFAKLTSQRIVNVKPAVAMTQPISSVTTPQLIKKVGSPGGGGVVSISRAPVVTSTSGLSSSNNVDLLKNPLFKNQNLDEKTLRRQQRMIKNRESACLSRKKKREYLQTLEGEVKVLTQENRLLKEENSQLKQQVVNLFQENADLKKRLLPKDIKKTTCVMAVIFMITLNLAPFGGLFMSSENESSSAPAISRQTTGRSLLWKPSINEDSLEDVVSGFLDKKNLYNKIQTSTSDSVPETHNISASLMCPMYINKTESLRLENELLGWVQRLEEKKKSRKKVKKPESPEELWLNKPRQKNLKFSKWLMEHRHNGEDRQSHFQRHNELQVYQKPSKSYKDLFEAIHRRDDTFYFVSFSGDHLLLPATAHNRTLRPKMSLVMPAMTFNETMEHPKDHVTMMQIDCQVMNTKLVYIKESAIPAHMWQKENYTSFESSLSQPSSRDVPDGGLLTISSCIIQQVVSGSSQHD
ncbi:cyclic AMP-dependent transcription factor ATF-6 alpha-like isoform X2 [Limulus polyphemus]|uniref:Cyclic AMP-dependent transcription factor ATF-6 alpha-like isoform X2 n=1 Tax=Limulus polyphemus TaxID=6850 RepID=A0ABM1S007_LIMPO|nr:cyclic AMP-dependent transcription factor ATF-6 alpha-like isoform X2 [Limulus polyphemus]